MRSFSFTLASLTLGGCLSAASTTGGGDGGSDAPGTMTTGVDTGHGGSDGGTGADVVTFVPDGTTAVEAGRREAGKDSSAPPEPEAGTSPDGGGSRCTMTAAQITCSEQMYTINTPAGADPEAGTTYPTYARVVHYQVPLGMAPAAGWPVVFMYQGSFLSAGLTFSAMSDDAYGLYYQTELVKNLLDNGFAVLAPEALDSGDTYWQTNISPYAADWSGAPDDVLVRTMIADVAAGTFGPLDATTLFATGISSGGYMSSRMAVSYVGKFKAIAIESGAYATCVSGESGITGGACTVPTLSATHPPTLFLHGTLDTEIVPEWTVQAYETALGAASIVYKEIDDAESGHQWIPEAPAAVLAWFQTYK